MNKLYFETLLSTNEYMKELSSNKLLESFTTIYCGNQTKGKGQQGNSWYSTPFKNLTFSIILFPNIHVLNSFDLNIIISMSIKKSLDIFFDTVKIKWPNDIYVNEKKICGILVENTIDKNIITKSIIGIGLNVNEICFPNNIHRSTSFFIEKNKEFDLNIILDLLISDIKYIYEDFLRNKEKYLDLYLKNLLFFNKKMIFEDSKGTFEGKIINVSEKGYLIVLSSENLEERKYSFKEIKYIF